MMYKLFKIIIVLLIAISCFGCSKDNETTLLIGSIQPLTGPAAQMGQEMQRGQMLAIDYWNSKKNIPKLSINFQDSKSNPKDGISSFQILRSSKVDIMTVSLSTVAVALKPLVQEQKVLMFADVSHPFITSPPNSLIFRHSQTAELEAQIITDNIFSHNIGGRLVVFYIADEYGSAFIKTIEARSANREIEYIPFAKDSTDFRSLALKGMLQDKDVILIVGVGQSVGLLIKSVRENGYRGLIYANIGYIVTGGRESAGAYGKGVKYTNLKVPLTDYGRWASEEYQKRYNKKITNEALLEFDTISLIVMASKKANSVEPSSIALKVRETVYEYYGKDLINKNNDILLDIVIEEDSGFTK